jgi:hypothetical protein
VFAFLAYDLYLLYHNYWNSIPKENDPISMLEAIASDSLEQEE